MVTVGCYLNAAIAGAAGASGAHGMGGDILVVGNTAFFAVAESGLELIYVSDPRNPRLVSSLPWSGEAWGVCGYRNELWVADLHEGVKLFDIADSGNITRTGGASAYAPHDIFWADGYVFLADQDRGLVILKRSE